MPLSRRKFGRRAFLAGAATALAGCLGSSTSRPEPPDPLADPPTGVYVPTHAAELRVVGTASAGRLRCALCFTHPLRFWVVTGTRISRVAASGDVHLLAVVWDDTTGRVLTGAAPRLTVTRAGKTVYDAAGWPMLSQRLGFHYGDNVALDDAGTYAVDVEAAPSDTTFTRDLAGVDSSARFAFEFEYDPAELSGLAFERPENAGEPGALTPRDGDGVPVARVPRELPGDSLGTQSLGDADLLATVLGDSSFAGEGAYVAVSPRTPYRRYPLPFMTLFGTLRGEAVRFDDVLAPTLDPELGYHYAARVDGVRSGDEFVVGVGAPPQVARHEGYETAFVATEPVEFTAE